VTRAIYDSKGWAIMLAGIRRTDRSLKPGNPRSAIWCFTALVAFALLAAGCGLFGDDDSPAELHSLQDLSALEVASPAFMDGDSIPVEFTCDGENVSPPLEWSQGPESTEEFVLIVDDPDAPQGISTHWILIHIPPDTTSIERGAVPNGAMEVETRAGEAGYRGPCPPEGEEHEYRFTVYAVDTVIDVSQDAGRNDVLAALEDHIVAGGQLSGMYRRE
jgi:Raf kinase inhibitor-like YbhB/YbcL family protein